MKYSREQKPPEDDVQAKSSTEDVELNEEQLEVVAGGIVEGGCFPTDFPGDTSPTFPNPILY